MKHKYIKVGEQYINTDYIEGIYDGSGICVIVGISGTSYATRKHKKEDILKLIEEAENGNS